MPPASKFSEQLKSICSAAARLGKQQDAEALLVLVERQLKWSELRDNLGSWKIIVAADREEHLEGSKEAGFDSILLTVPDSPVHDQLTQAMLESVADDLLAPGALVVALYSGFDVGSIDSMSVIRLDEHLGRLTVRDLRQLETRVPLEVLKQAVDLAVDIGREGREGKPVGTLIVVGDHRKVLKHCRPMGFDPVKGYNSAERKLDESRVRESIKEIAQLDGAIVVSADGTVAAACQHLSAPSAELTLSKGLGARHWAAASISRATAAIAIAVSESNGTVRIFQDGEVMLRVEPFRRAMKWKDFEYDPPGSGD
ncbi:MAG: DNA integrity scanning protein DisA nucleotide-binding domain protein [Planctomycetota bacterium]